MSLTELIYSPEHWAQSDYFVTNKTSIEEAQVSPIEQAQATLITALKVADAAEGSPSDPFVYFRTTIAKEPSWTGVLVFNGTIDGREMPPDLQMLFAGIDGVLTAHHFGVELNQIQHTPSPLSTTEIATHHSSQVHLKGKEAGNDESTTPTLTKSSLFGVIHYPTALPSQNTDVVGLNEEREETGKYNFFVKNLDVFIHNSLVEQFHCEVGMTIHQLFERRVTLDSEHAGTGNKPDTLYIKGRYQYHGKVGTVVFSAEESGNEFLFNKEKQPFIRVTDSFNVRGARSCSGDRRKTSAHTNC